MDTNAPTSRKALFKALLFSGLAVYSLVAMCTGSQSVWEAVAFVFSTMLASVYWVDLMPQGE